MNARRLIVPSLVPIAFFAGTLVSAAFTQQGQPAPIVTEFDFMKVAPEKEDDYLKLERELWKPVHRERIRTGKMRSWTLYAVRYPFGTERTYDYVTVNEYNTLADADRSIDDIFAKVHPTIKLEEIGRRTVDARQLVRGEMWYRIDHVE